jgi:hypothetical protein
MSRLLAAIAIVLLFSGCPSVPQGSSGAAMRDIGGGVIELSASGMRFPAAVSGFTRGEVHKYDPTGRDVGVGYNSTDPSAPIAITVYVYPSPPVPASGPSASEAKAAATHEVFERAKAEIFQVHKGVKSITEQEIPSPESSAHQAGYFGRFAYAEKFAGAVRPVESLLYVYCYVGESWTVKYRVTYPATSFGARTMVNRFVQDLTWTIKGPN